MLHPGRRAKLWAVMALAAQDLGLAVCQASVYTPDGEFEAARLLRGLAPACLERFDTEPQVVSHPASPHPRILLHSTTGMWRCEIAADRTDFYWIRPEARAPAPMVDEFYQVAAGVLAHYAEVSGSRIGRLAAVVKRLAEHTAPALLAVDHFTRPELAGTALEGTESFELYAHKRHVLGRFVVNAAMRCRAAGDGTVDIEQDLNTLAEQAASRRFTLEEIAEFFRLTAREHEHVLALYFPAR
jgi:hypothetical protein